MSLSLVDIRALASECNYEEVYFNEQSRLVSFKNRYEPEVRINVYYTTYTVGTCIDHPRQGRTQLFRRNMNTKQLLEAIFVDPRLHTGVGYQRRPLFADPLPCVDEEAELQAHLMQLDLHLADMNAQREMVLKTLRTFEAAREREAAAENLRRLQCEAEQRAEVVRKERQALGDRCEIRCFAAEEAVKMFNSCTVCVAISHDDHGVIFIYQHDDGSFSNTWTAGIPSNISKRLRTRAASHPQPVYLSLGSQGRYYMKFTNGGQEWIGFDDADTIKLPTRAHVKSVSFGEDDAYIIHLDDDTFLWKNIPEDMAIFLNGDAHGIANARKVKQMPIRKVLLSPDGGGMVLFANGAWNQFGLDNTSFYDVLSLCRKVLITDVVLGFNQSCLVRYQ